MEALKMSQQQLIADTLTHGGSTITAVSFSLAFFNFLDAHHYAVLALCGMGGFIISCIGAWVSHKNKLLVRKVTELDAKIKQEKLNQLRSERK